jgi:hypothetical protein|nr:MAG TPA: hypothetical protein [Caudoviricetes sp.]
MGTRARGGITLHNVKNSADAEYYRLQPQSEKAVVGVDNALYITLSYIIEHVKGAQVTTEAGSAQGYHVTARMNNGVTISMTNGAVNSGTYKLTNYSKAQNRPDYVIIELKDNANKVVDTRTAQIIMESSSYVDVVGDLRTTVSQQGESITTIKQTADSISLKVDGIKNGVKNLIKGGQLNRTFKTYGIGGDDVVIPLKPDTVYTLTICGHTNNITRANGQMLRAYIFRKDWVWSMNTDIDNNSDTISSITFSIPSDRASTDGMYKFDAYPFPDKGSQNGEVTVNWVTLTEGTQAAASWIPADGETGEDKAKEVELRLENGEFRVKNDKTVFVDNSGKETVLIQNGKLWAGLIDALEIVTKGLKAGNIDAGNATISNLHVTGNSVFDGTINTSAGKLAGWKIEYGAIHNENVTESQGDGISIGTHRLIYNIDNAQTQVTFGTVPIVSYNFNYMGVIKTPSINYPTVGLCVDIAPDSRGDYENVSVYTPHGSHKGFRRSLRVISGNDTLTTDDSAILFAGVNDRKLTLPADAEHGQEYTIYNVSTTKIVFEVASRTDIIMDFVRPTSSNGVGQDGYQGIYHIVYSRYSKKWFIYLT